MRWLNVSKYLDKLADLEEVLCAFKTHGNKAQKFFERWTKRRGGPISCQSTAQRIAAGQPIVEFSWIALTMICIALKAYSNATLFQDGLREGDIIYHRTMLELDRDIKCEEPDSKFSLSHQKIYI